MRFHTHNKWIIHQSWICYNLQKSPHARLASQLCVHVCMGEMQFHASIQLQESYGYSPELRMCGRFQSREVVQGVNTGVKLSTPTSSSYCTMSMESLEKYTSSMLSMISCSAWGSIGCSLSSLSSSWETEREYRWTSTYKKSALYSGIWFPMKLRSNAPFLFINSSA